jgi:hypothetical protein
LSNAGVSKPSSSSSSSSSSTNVDYSSPIYQTLVSIPNRRQLSLTLNAYFDWDNYGREKIGNELVNQLAGESKYLIGILLTLQLIREGKDASALAQASNMIPSYGSTLSPYHLLSVMCPRELIVKMWHHENPGKEEVDVDRLAKLLAFMIHRNDDSMNFFNVEREIHNMGPAACSFVDDAFGTYKGGGSEGDNKLTLSKHITHVSILANEMTSFFNFVPSCLRVLKDHGSELDDSCKLRLFRILAKYPDIAYLDPDYVGFNAAASYCKNAIPKPENCGEDEEKGDKTKNDDLSKIGDDVYKALTLVGRYPIFPDGKHFETFFSIVDGLPIAPHSFFALVVGKIYAHAFIPHLAIPDVSSSWTISCPGLSFAVLVTYYVHNKRWSVDARSKAQSVVTTPQ